MLIKTAVFMVILLVIVVFRQMCIAGTWIDDFSDQTLRDPGRGGLINDEVSATVVDGHFYYRGKNQRARYEMQNWKLGNIQDFSLELKFMVRNVRVPQESSWIIRYALFNEETWDFDGIMHFMLWYTEEEPNVTFVTIDRFVLEDHPEFGQVWRANTAAIDRFAYEKRVWYTLRIEREGNQYTFSIGDVSLFTEDDSVPIGSIGIRFHGKCNIR